MKGEKGFTLAEVLAALVIMGLVLSTAAQTMAWLTRLVKRGQESIEINQAARAALLLIEREIRQAKKVELLNPAILRVTKSNGQIVLFYAEDKDNNGIKDLYIETGSTPNPVASFIEEASFYDCGQGKWEVELYAKKGSVENRWKVTVKQRVN